PSSERWLAQFSRIYAKAREHLWALRVWFLPSHLVGRPGWPAAFERSHPEPRAHAPARARVECLRHSGRILSSYVHQQSIASCVRRAASWLEHATW
ncbi:unnamed protein product, partial [Amoebophrya sp. A120]